MFQIFDQVALVLPRDAALASPEMIAKLIAQSALALIASINHEISRWSFRVICSVFG